MIWRRTVTLRLQSHAFLRQIGGMMLLTVLGQGLYVAASPFVGRIYSPEEMGYFGLFIAIWTVLASGACGLYDLAIPAVHDDEEARHLSVASVVVGLFVSIVAGCGLSLAVAKEWFGLGVFPLWIGSVMTAAMLTQIAILIGQAWAIRRNEVMKIGQANVLMNGWRGILQVTGGLLSANWTTLVAGEMIARLAQARHLNFSFRNTIHFFRRRNDLMAIIRRHRNYPLIFGPSFALDASASFLQTAMIGFLFGPAQMGQFFLMRRTLDLPVAFAFKSLSDLFFVRLLTLSRDDPAQLRPFFLKSSTMLAAIGLATGAPVIVWGSELFKLFYGPNWGTAGLLAAMMVPAMALNLAVAPVARVFQLTQKAHLRLVPSAVNLLGTSLILCLAKGYNFTLEAVVASLSIVTCLQYIVYFGSGYFVAGHVALDSRNHSDNND